MAKRPARQPAAETPEAPPAHAPPLALRDVLGQAHAVELLRAAMRSGRVHHAWVFHGPEGVGKFTSALAFAAAVLDPTTNPDDDRTPDPESHVQRLLAAAAHPDLHVVNKELTPFSREASVRGQKQRTIPFGIAEEFLVEPATRTRNLHEPSLVAKVFIVDEAHLLGGDAQNLLLKTLEEPPEGTVIILVTPAEEELLPTIRSRCQRIPFLPLADADMREWLRRGGAAIDAKHEAWALRYAAGSPGVLKRVIEGNLTAWHEALAPMLADADRGKFDLSIGATMAKLVDDRAAAMVARNPVASKEAANVAAAADMLRLVAVHHHGAMRGSRRPEVRARAIELVAEAERQIERNVPLAFIFENLAAQLVDMASRAVATR
ncbi:MAG TPA: hypothetical protein PLU35_03445 [Phycisphaerales bacterium]|nr:hypothetical protein [Phycisphaerales bacterium]